jgi:hypothetical protein
MPPTPLQKYPLYVAYQGNAKSENEKNPEFSYLFFSF